MRNGNGSYAEGKQERNPGAGQERVKSIDAVLRGH